MVLTTPAPCSNTLNSTPVTLTVGNLWTGAIDGNANNGGNWTCGTPNSTTDAIIPASGTQPVLSANLDVRNITYLGSGSTLDLNGLTLSVYGAITGTGNLKGSATSNLTVAGTAGVINMASSFRTLNNLTITTTGNASISNTLDIYGALQFTPAGGTFDMNTQSVTFKSTNTATARVGDLTGSILNGATMVTVERFINDAGHRSWRLLSGNQ